MHYLIMSGVTVKQHQFEACLPPATSNAKTWPCLIQVLSALSIQFILLNFSYYVHVCILGVRGQIGEHNKGYYVSI